MPDLLNTSSYDFVPVFTHGDLDVNADFGMVNNVHVRIQSIYINNYNQAIAVYEDGTEMIIGTVPNFPVPVTLVTDSDNVSVSGTTLVFATNAEEET